MDKIYDSLFAYGLHDTTVSEIRTERAGISFYFNEGIYLLDSTGKETVKSESAWLIIGIEFFANENVYQHLSCRIYKHGKRKDVDPSYFTEKAKRSGVEISNIFSIFAFCAKKRIY